MDENQVTEGIHEETDALQNLVGELHTAEETKDIPKVEEVQAELKVQEEKLEVLTKELKAVPQAPPELLLTPQEYCIEKSRTYKKVELLGGFFHYIVKVKKVVKQTRKFFDDALSAFERMPV